MMWVQMPNVQAASSAAEIGFEIGGGESRWMTPCEMLLLHGFVVSS